MLPRQSPATLLGRFSEQLDDTIHLTWTNDSEVDYLDRLARGVHRIVKATHEVGDVAYSQLQSPDITDDTDQFDFYLLNFFFPERVKSFLLLWRDVLLEQLKARVRATEEHISEARLRQLRGASERIVREAAEVLKSDLANETARYRSSRGGKTGAIAAWRLQANPWTTYRAQLDQLPEQCDTLTQRAREMLAASEVFQRIRTRTERMITDCEQEVQRIRASSENAVQYIEQQTASEDPRPGKIISYLEQMEQELTLSNHLQHYSSDLDHLVNTLPEKLRVPIGTDGGLLQIRELNFRKVTRQWLESEILPLLYEIWEQTLHLKNGLRMSLVNIRNRAVLLNSESEEGQRPDFERADLTQPLQLFERRISGADQSISELRATLQTRMESEFHLAAVFTPNANYLPVPLQSTINQFRDNQSRIFQRGRRFYLQQVARLQRFRRQVEAEEALSISERIVRYVESRTEDPDASHYTSIFSTKGYIGESFWVGRREELRHVEQLVKQWNMGYRGSLALTGQRLSGKSLFGELVAQQLFAERSVRLKPNSTLTVAGRRLKVEYNLRAALDFVRKYTLNQPTLLWIDDLECWRDPAVPLSSNVRALAKSMDSYAAGELFFMVSMSNWLFQRLQRAHDLNKVFQSEINLDRMAYNEIREAILIRHGATHQQLVQKDGAEVSPPQFNRLVKRIYKNSEGNIGEALIRWSAGIRQVAEERVRYQPPTEYNLPDFINSDNGLLLSAIMLSRRTTEYRLRKQFGPAFNTKYLGILQRLLSVGLLRRQLDGWLQVNDVVANDLGRLLEQRDFIKLHR